jgi:hypothetical protein
LKHLESDAKIYGNLFLLAMLVKPTLRVGRKVTHAAGPVVGVSRMVIVTVDKAVFPNAAAEAKRIEGVK